MQRVSLGGHNTHQKARNDVGSKGGYWTWVISSVSLGIFLHLWNFVPLCIQCLHKNTVLISHLKYVTVSSSKLAVYEYVLSKLSATIFVKLFTGINTIDKKKKYCSKEL